MMHPDPSAPKRLLRGSRAAVAALGGVAFLGGLLSFLGWVCNLPRLADWAHTGISIQPNATLAAMASGLALMSLGCERRRPAAVLGTVTGLIGATALFENLTGVNLGIDHLLMFDRPWGRAATVAPGRMGAPGSISWTLVGTAVLLVLRDPAMRRVTPWLGLLVAGIAGLSLTGYLFRADLLYSLPRLTAIAAQTATLLIATGFGLAAAVPDQQPMRALLERSGAGILARRALPLILLLPIVLGMIRLQGQQAGLYDTEMGVALLIFTFILLMILGLGWAVAAVGAWERSLAEANEALGRADMALRSASEQVILIDQDWRYAFTNDRVSEATGLTREQMVGRTLWELFPAVVGTELETVARRVMERRESESLDYFFEPWQRWFELRMHPAPNGGIAFFALEITERKRAEAALQASDRKKDEFLATLAHELRNPLAPIRTAVRIIRLEGCTESIVDRQHEIIDRQVGNMARLLDDLLDVSRITRGAVNLAREDLDFSELVGRVLDTSRSLLEQQGRDLRLQLTRQPLPLHVDRLRLEQVVMNLVNNAAKYTGDGGIITVTTDREGDEAVLRVIDNGRGIAPELLPLIFDLFVQDERTQDVSQGGLGIGLTLVKNMVELHGGRVEGHSEGLDRGSEFVVRLPLAAPQRPTLTAPIGDDVPTLAPLRSAPHRVLVVDDNRDAADALGDLLQLWEFNAQVAYDGHSGLAMLDGFLPEVVFLDIGMPHLDGYEVARRIRQHPKHQKTLLVAVTGFGQEGDRRRAREAGFDEHLTKPVDPIQIERLLKERFTVR